MPQKSSEADKFFESLSTFLPEIPYQLCQSSDQLLLLLRKAYLGTHVIVLFLQTRGELEEILPLQDYFEGMKLLLVLPDEENQTIAQALRLLPRYKSSIGGNFTELCMVLKKMIFLYDRESYAK